MPTTAGGIFAPFRLEVGCLKPEALEVCGMNPSLALKNYQELVRLMKV